MTLHKRSIKVVSFVTLMILVFQIIVPPLLQAKVSHIISDENTLFSMPPAQTEDTIPPASVTNLVAKRGTQAGTIDLSWNAPGDDATAGTATSYIIRYGIEPITDGNWLTATNITGEPVPAPAGSDETMTVTGLAPGQIYYFAIKTQDEVPNESSISNISQARVSANHAIYLPLIMRGASENIAIIPDTTEVLTDTTTQYLSSVSDNGTVFTFTQSTPALESLSSGEVLISNATTGAPNGFLKKVVSVVENNGQIIVETQDATLEEAVDTGEIHTRQMLNTNQIQQSTQLKGVTLIASPQATDSLDWSYALNNVVLYDVDGNLGTTNDQVIANGDIALEVGFDFDLDVQNFQLKEFAFSTIAEENANLEIKTNIAYTITEEKEIARHTFQPITLWIGVVPVVIVPVLTVRVGVDGQVYVGVTTSVVQQATLTAGVQYANGHWNPTSDFSNYFYYSPPTLSSSLNFKGYAGPRLSLLLYGVAGPYAEVNAYLDLEANINADPWWTLYGGIDVPVGVTVELLGKSIVDYKVTPIDYRLILAQAQTNTPPNLPYSPIPANNAINQPLNATLSWSGGDSDGDTVTYDIYFEANDSTPDVLISNDQSATSYTPETLNANTRYYWKIVAQDEHGATTLSPTWSFVTNNGVGTPGEMVLIPAGNFQMGCDPATDPDAIANGYCPVDESPLHTIYLDSFFIDKYEVTNAQYRACVNAGICTTPYSNASMTRSDYFTNSAYNDYPVIYISWNDAVDYCTWVGKRLPTDAEWAKAARGSDDTRPYPWGSTAPNCTLANFYDNATDIYCVGDTDAVGSYPAGSSPYGVQDMAGNVSELVNDWYQWDYYSVSPVSNPPGPISGKGRVVREGSWAGHWFWMRIPLRQQLNPDSREYNIATGFRCADSP